MESQSFVLLFGVFCLTCCPLVISQVGEGVTLSQDAIDELLRLHNYYRETVEPTAANMQALVSMCYAVPAIYGTWAPVRSSILVISCFIALSQ